MSKKAFRIIDFFMEKEFFYLFFEAEKQESGYGSKAIVQADSGCWLPASDDRCQLFRIL